MTTTPPNDPIAQLVAKYQSKGHQSVTNHQLVDKWAGNVDKYRNSCTRNKGKGIFHTWDDYDSYQLRDTI